MSRSVLPRVRARSSSVLVAVLGAAAALAAATACSATTRAGPDVTVFRATSRTCLELLSDTAPSAELGLPAPCNDVPVTAPLLAGIDQVELVIDYGDTDFAASAAVPAPTVDVTVDGKPSQISPGVLARPRVHGHTLFVATFTAPSTISNNVQVTVNVVPGFSTRVTRTLQTAAPAPAISVLRRLPADCLAAITSNVPDPELGLASPCGSAPPTLFAAVDLVELVIDHGALDVPRATVPPPPTVAVSVDGTAVAVPVAVAPVQRVHDHLFFTATFHAPSTISSDVRITVTTVGIGTTLETVFATVAPVPAVEIVECSGTADCEVAGAVGSVHLRVTVPGDVPQSISFHSYIDGFPVADPATPMQTLPGDGGTEVQVEVPVPAAPTGAQWNLQAQLGAAHTLSRSLTVQKPAIAASLSCPSPCSVSPGAAVGLTVVAPRGIRPPMAVYSTRLDGVPQLSNATLDLTASDASAGTVSNTVTLTAPPSSGLWTIDVSVAGYPADTLHVQVAGP